MGKQEFTDILSGKDLQFTEAIVIKSKDGKKETTFLKIEGALDLRLCLGETVGEVCVSDNRSMYDYALEMINAIIDYQPNIEWGNLPK